MIPRTAMYVTRKQTAREWKKADVGTCHQTENEKEKIVGTYISPFVVALAACVDSNPSSREKKSLEK